MRKTEIKYTKRARRNGKEIWHQERWSVDRGRFYVERLIEDGTYQIGVRSGYQPPIFFNSIQELGEFTRFISRAVLDSVVIPIPRERRRK